MANNECAYCGGNKECGYCHGKGQIDTNLTVGARDRSDESTVPNSVGVRQTCPHCHGSAECPKFEA